ncbi:MAG: toll/interleukin-1 receptor domain-containing protein [Anaeroplasmataceae bacterium]|nr:toll/interleukin-1 receptor domain-containing protein [Anaeroplasmataceae bacterium]MDE6414597.1 toll/interleukin-1 receptor domain-containing protein [Anaeroplasmataceae bacterium]
MNDIFISYKVHNRKTAIEYYKALKTQSYEVWFDQLVPKDADWKETIAREIKDSRLIVCLLSEACLLDDWVLYQLETARRYHKEILYITLDDTDWQQHKEYHVKNDVYHTLEELPLDHYFINEEAKKEKILGLPLLNIGLMVIFSLMALLAGLDFLNLSLDYRYGCVLVGITCLLVLSYWNNKIVYFIQGGLAIGLLCVTMYVVAPYYISSVSINSMFFLLFYLFAFVLRYSKINLWLALLASLFYSVFITALDSVIVIFINHFFDFDCSWISIIFLVAFLFYKFWCIKDDFK